MYSAITISGHTLRLTKSACCPHELFIMIKYMCSLSALQLFNFYLSYGLLVWRPCLFDVVVITSEFRR